MKNGWLLSSIYLCLAIVLALGLMYLFSAYYSPSGRTTLVLATEVNSNKPPKPDFPLSFRKYVRSSSDVRRWKREWFRELKTLLHLDSPIKNLPSYEMLVPENSGNKLPTVIIVSGHSYGINTVLEPYKGRGTRAARDGNVGIGYRLYREGYVVFTLDLKFQGKRAKEYANGLNTGTHDLASNLYIMQGLSLTEVHVKEVLAVLDIIKHLPEVDNNRIGIIGLSSGATVAAIVGVQSSDISAVYYASGTTSYCYISNCIIHSEYLHDQLPGLYAYGDYIDLLSLVSPKPLLVTFGSSEENEGIKYDRENSFSYNYLKNVYSTQGATGNLYYNVHDGGHTYDIPTLLEFLDKYLK